jgi:pimeloyl-ACP methyl ester carboxylesterase
MATFVLVHGAFVGSWIWEPVVELLERDGATVRAPDLPGSGEDYFREEVTLDACVERVVSQIDRFGEPAIVAAQGFGGIVITQLAARLPEAVGRLVYISGYLPRDGQSMLDLTRLPEAADEELESSMTIDGQPAVGVLTSRAASRALFNAASSSQLRWALDRVRPQPLAPLGTPVALGRAEPSPSARVYVYCLKDHAVPLALQRRMVAENACASTHEIDADHCPSLSRPHSVARILTTVAGQLGPRRA